MIDTRGALLRVIGGAALCLPLACMAGDWSLRMDGVGPLALGMRFDEANLLLGGTLQRELPGSEECYYASIGQHPGLLVMFADGVLRRVDVMRDGPPTAEGVAVGDPAKRVLEVYPKAASTPNAYDDRERYLTVRSPNGELALRFETLDGRVGSFYAGRFKEVQYIEGCL
jgi:hypothetical protein